MKDAKQLWYVPDEKTLHAEGPFSTPEIMGMVRAGEIRIDSFVFRAEFRQFGWKRISEISDFSELLVPHPVCPAPMLQYGGASVTEQKLSQLEEAYGSGKDRRRFLRAPVTADCFVHNQREIVKGRASEISEADMSLLLDGSQFKPGDEVILTVRCPEPINTFSVHAAVMRITTHAKSQLLVTYFLHPNPATRRRIAEYVVAELSRTGAEKAAA